jgi:hypothetical protein
MQNFIVEKTDILHEKFDEVEVCELELDEFHGLLHLLEQQIHLLFKMDICLAEQILFMFIVRIIHQIFLIKPDL